MSDAVANLVRRAVYLREGEGRALLWSTAFFFLILASYFIIRPIRDQMGLAGGARNLPYLMTFTMLGVMLLHPLYTTLVGKLPRKRFVPYTYRFFILNLVLFWTAFQVADATQAVWIARAFFIWTSVFNLFIVTVFWSFMVDVYRPLQSKRLFGIIAVGGTAGAVLGTAITSTLVGVFGPVNLLLLSAVGLELAGQASRILGRHESRLAESATAELDEIRAREATGGPPDGTIAGFEAGAGEVASPPGVATGVAPGPDAPQADPTTRPADHSDDVIGGGVLDGIRHVIRSPYLIGIAVLLTFFAFTSTILWMHLNHLIERTMGGDAVGQTRLFANMEFVTQSLTLITQLFLTSRILRWLGVTVALAFLPVLTLIGFGILGAAPVLAVAVVFMVIRRAGNFAIQRPAREVLYTVLSRTEKYKAKHFNDTIVYRTVDQLGGYGHNLLTWLGLGLSAIALAMLPLTALWFGLAIWLGFQHRRIERTRAEQADPDLATAR